MKKEHRTGVGKECLGGESGRYVISNLSCACSVDLGVRITCPVLTGIRWTVGWTEMTIGMYDCIRNV